MSFLPDGSRVHKYSRFASPETYLDTFPCVTLLQLISSSLCISKIYLSLVPLKSHESLIHHVLRRSRCQRSQAICRGDADPLTLWTGPGPQRWRTVDPDFLKQNVQTTTQAERIEREEEEREAYEERKAKSKAKAKAKAKASSVRSNAHNPVYLGNAVLLALTGAGLGYGAYRKHAAGQLSWELIGWCSGAVGAFGAVDYFVSKWLLQNKYPPK
ncbi:hypothetical protein CBS63078_10478 [Aspergillus niger]|nr:hypothetical protein CBS115989_423 [Aspergillus niger]KAI2832093.1 hypothetical protein CBS133816_1970 [Aspergillus niger]KAI2840691.1 hypothetical protein CBS11232_8984 [Aspergillus niger]KAI2847686.1 hypothetical protein CBS12448_9287 [Aspergillus niger]KAI2849068.1 hypothetical protein CBS11350_2220 [Aspergillus niger]